MQVRKFFARIAAGALLVAPLVVVANSEAQAAGPCTFSHSHYSTYNSYCPNGSKHYIKTGSLWWTTYHYGNLARSYRTSTVNMCYAGETGWGTLVY
jgi:hypothetical protein